MYIDSHRVLKSLRWDLGIKQLRTPYTSPTSELVDTFSGSGTYNPAAAEIASQVRCDRSLDPDAVGRLLQILEVFNKQPGHLNRDQVLKKLIDKQSSIGNLLLDIPVVSELRRVIKHYIGESPDGFEDLVRHGPGATAEKALFDDKWHALRSRPRALEYCFSAIDPINRLSSSPVDVPARVIVVEKNYKGGRVIAAEQASRQFVQQGLGRLIIERLKFNARIDVSDVDAHVRFLRQNLTDSTTVDLSDASDYVSVGLVNALFPRKWARVLNAARSHSLNVSGVVMKTKTMALMGNGFCFPVLTTICAALCASASGSWRAHKTWSVFGDDIIIAHPFYYRLRALIARAGLIINDEKTFTPDRNFAETCGVDLVRSTGTNVRPRFIRFHDRISDFKDLIKLCDFQRYAGYAAWDETASYLRGEAVKSGAVFAACDPPNLPGWIYDSKAPQFINSRNSRWNRKLQRLEVISYQGNDPKRDVSLDVGESWAKATFGSQALCETLSRSGRFKKTWVPLGP